MMTPSKGKPISSPSADRMRRMSENSNPNLTPGSVSVKSKPSSTFANALCAASQRIKERKFVVAKKNAKASAVDNVSCKCGEKNAVNSKKCRCVAYESLRTSQEEFFRNRNAEEVENEPNIPEKPIMQVAEEENDEKRAQDRTEASEDFNPEKTISPRKLRTQVLEEALNSLPEQGSGRVRHLVKAFESLLSFTKYDDAIHEGEKPSKVMKWALPGLQPPLTGEVSSLSNPFSVSSSSEFFNKLNSGMDSIVFASVDSSEGSLGSRTSSGGRRNSRNSTDSIGRMVGRSWNKQLKVTSQKPFKLRTEQRGKQKQDEFLKRVQDMLVEEARQRIPLAQGLPWTTDEPECLVKPAVKESTRPLDVKLHSHVRAAERAEFDQAIAEKSSFIEQCTQEQERQQKLAEEEEIKRLRRELVPRAQPMPYFDRPFIPKRSFKQPTIPREPKFHVPHHKKIKCMSWNDINFQSTSSHEDITRR